MKFCLPLLIFITTFFSGVSHADEAEARRLLVQVVLTKGDDQEQAMIALEDEGASIIGTMFEAWRVGRILTHQPEGLDQPEVLLEDDRRYTDLLTGEVVTPTAELKKNRPKRKLRKRFKRMVDLLDLSSPDLGKRIQAAEKLGMSQKPDYLPELKRRIDKQSDEKVKTSFQEAVAISELANGSPEEQISAVVLLGEMKSLRARDFITKLVDQAVEGGASHKDDLVAASKVALNRIDSHQNMIEWAGTIVRGLSRGSILLLVSYGLAITFGQMGVINMAHGEFIAIGGYTTYKVQEYFAKAYGPESAAFEWYFLVALPLAFLASAIAGAILEKGLIRFLYSRPLESLLATWGVSMILQQVFRLTFGAANVSVSSPQWLSGSYEFAGIFLSYSRISCVVFALFVIVATYLLMTKTNWGLHVRATMQNRKMASALGVPSSRVNMLTFAFGSGLAGLAGAFLSQIGNVGPSMGQTYIVDSFMVVVVGGVGNLLGAALSSLGIGLVDQSLQPVLGPVMGKISVLFGIILFLQFKPGGLFPSRSRSLED